MADEQLQDAIKLLQAGRREEARRLLMALLRENPEDENAWLVLSAAVDDPVRRRQALETALEINPENSIAQTQLKKFEPVAAAVEEPEPASTVETDEPEPVFVDEADETEPLPDFDENEAEVVAAEVEPAVVPAAEPTEVAPAEVVEKENGRRSRWFLILAAIPLLCLCVVLAVFLVNFGG